jgi:aminoacyl tRNA synthase complex-interacting multifunctional protein 1
MSSRLVILLFFFLVFFKLIVFFATFKGSRVLVICNLKSRKLQGVESNGMVLCCSNTDHTKVDLVVAPESVAPGARVTCGSLELPAKHAEVLNPKKKVWENGGPFLAVKDGVAVFDGVPLSVGGVPLKCSASNGTIG